MNLARPMLAVAGLLAALPISEGILGLAGFPVAAPERTTNPPGLIEYRDNIEYRYKYATNRYGIRYRDGDARDTAGRASVLVLGDSFVEGVGVHAAQRFTDLLETSYGRRREPVLFINGGLTGVGPKHYERAFRYLRPIYKPRAVLICLFANDVTDTPAVPEARPGAPRLFPRLKALWRAARRGRESRARRDPWDMVGWASAQARKRAVPEERIRRWREALPPSLVEAARDGRFNRGLLALGLLQPDYWTDALDLSSARSEAQYQAMTDRLAAIVDESKAAGVEVGLVYIPTYLQYDPRSHEPSNPLILSGVATRREWLTTTSAVQAGLASWASARRLPFLDLTPTFRKAVAARPRLNFPLDGHWTPEGHRRAAEAIERWLDSGALASLPKTRR